MSQNAAGSTQSTMQAAGEFLSEKASQAQSVVAEAAQSVKAAVRACNELFWMSAWRLHYINPLHCHPLTGA